MKAHNDYYIKEFKKYSRKQSRDQFFALFFIAMGFAILFVFVTLFLKYLIGMNGQNAGLGGAIISASIAAVSALGLKIYENRNNIQTSFINDKMIFYKKYLSIINKYFNLDIDKHYELHSEMRDFIKKNLIKLEIYSSALVFNLTFQLLKELETDLNNSSIYNRLPFLLNAIRKDLHLFGVDEGLIANFIFNKDNDR